MLSSDNVGVLCVRAFVCVCARARASVREAPGEMLGSEGLQPSAFRSLLLLLLPFFSLLESKVRGPEVSAGGRRVTIDAF